MRRIPGFQPRHLSPPWEEKAPVTFRGETPGRFLRGLYGGTVAHDAFSAASDIRKAGLWANIVDAFVPLHYGTFGGRPVQFNFGIFSPLSGVLRMQSFSRFSAGPGLVKPQAPRRSRPANPPSRRSTGSADR